MSYAPNSQATGNPPSGDDIPQESTGPIAADSLAAESLKQDGDFAQGDAVPSSVKGASSTFANTDTSGATALHPAPSGAVRERQDEAGLGSDEKGAAGLKYPDAAGLPTFSGTTTSQGYSGGPSSDRASDGYNTQAAGASDFGSTALGSSESTSEIKSSANTEEVPGSVTAAPSTTGVRPFVDAAPNYTGRVSGAIQGEGYGKPKGQGLTEGDVPETKTFTGDVGGPNDPGRLAERGFEQANAASAEGVARDYTQGGDNPYDTLQSSERA